LTNRSNPERVVRSAPSGRAGHEWGLNVYSEDNRAARNKIRQLPGSTLMAGGFYNHYDDPDEFWDEEPIEPKPRAPSGPPTVSETRTVGRPSSYNEPPAAASHSSASRNSVDKPSPTQRKNVPRADSDADRMARLGITPPPKSALVSVEVGSDLLPINISLSRGWKNSFAPHQYGQSIIDGYRYGLFVLGARMVESGALPPPTVPTLRDATPLLLKTRTIEEFRELYNLLFLSEPTTVHGPGLDESGRPALSVTATESKLISIDIDRNWADRIDVNFIAQDILGCCQKIRARRPPPSRDAVLDKESNSEMASRVLQHEQYLLQHG